jgi:hypothetical protein
MRSFDREDSAAQNEAKMSHLFYSKTARSFFEVIGHFSSDARRETVIPRRRLGGTRHRRCIIIYRLKVST